VRVPLTHHDLRRLTEDLGRPAASLVEWLAPTEVDMTDEPGAFAELGVGRRLMVLRYGQGGCHLLDARGRCTAYAARPYDCRLYPFDLVRDEGGRIERIGRLDRHAPCGDEEGPAAELAEVARLDEERWAALADYQRQLVRWNKLARHRQRFGKSPGDAHAFLAFLGFR
jgi:Fe-S-cluster containining protein